MTSGRIARLRSGNAPGGCVAQYDEVGLRISVGMGGQLYPTIEYGAVPGSGLCWEASGMGIIVWCQTAQRAYWPLR